MGAAASRRARAGGAGLAEVAGDAGKQALAAHDDVGRAGRCRAQTRERDGDRQRWRRLGSTRVEPGISARGRTREAGAQRGESASSSARLRPVSRAASSARWIARYAGGRWIASSSADAAHRPSRLTSACPPSASGSAATDASGGCRAGRIRRQQAALATWIERPTRLSGRAFENSATGTPERSSTRWRCRRIPLKPEADRVSCVARRGDPARHLPRRVADHVPRRSG